jgi:Fur family ferric uptake transcriptional regulator
LRISKTTIEGVFRMPPQRRETRQRVAVAAALDDVDSFVSAQQLHSLLRDQGDGVGLATVYRTLQQLAEDGEVDVLRTSETESMYRRCSSGHHHHLVCRFCRTTVEVDSAAVERWARRIADDNGFIDVGHVVEVFGTCAACAAAGKGTPRNTQPAP